MSLQKTINKKQKSITLKTDYPFKEFKLFKFREYIYYDFIKNKHELSGGCFFFNDFGGRKYYPDQIYVESIDTDSGTVHLSYK